MSEILPFDYDTAQRGQEVTEETYNDNLNVLPPMHLRTAPGYVAGFQVSEPYCHRTDTRNGAWRPMYATFTCSGGRYFYQGVNFTGEIDSRPFVKEPDGYAR